MNTIFNIKLIESYIAGDDVDGYTTDELEDNCIFMRQVIEYTDDKNMYKFCSERVKNNPGFIKFLVLKFSDDIDFIRILAYSYIDKIDLEDVISQEIVVLFNDILVKYLGTNIDYHLLDYCVKSAYLYQKQVKESLEVVKSFDTWEDVEDFGLGFKEIMYKYWESDIMLDFFARRYLLDLFCSEYSGVTLEELIHKEYKKLDDLKKKGIENCLLEMIGEKDRYLRNYADENPGVLNTLTDRIDFVCLNWDNYMRGLNIRRVEIFYQEIDNYFAKHEDLSFSDEELIFYVVDKLKLKDFFGLGEIVCTDEEGNCIWGINSRKYLKVEDLVCIKWAMNMTRELFEVDVICAPHNIDLEKDAKLDEGPRVKARIKKFDPNKRLDKNK